LLRRICAPPGGASSIIAPRRNSGKHRKIQRFEEQSPSMDFHTASASSNRQAISPMATSLVSNCKQGENAPMSIQSHLSKLSLKHEALEREIEAERTHPGGDSLRLAELKRRKLSLKDEIARLQVDTVH
jgi:hypothetical protein